MSLKDRLWVPEKAREKERKVSDPAGRVVLDPAMLRFQGELARQSAAQGAMAPLSGQVAKKATKSPRRATEVRARRRSVRQARRRNR